MQHGVRSTLIIKQAIASDFGPYTCAIQNEHGVSELRIELEEKSKFFTSDHSHIYFLYVTKFSLFLLRYVCTYLGVVKQRRRAYLEIKFTFIPKK